MANQTKMAQVHTAIADLQRLTELFRMRRKQLAAGVGLTEHQWSVLEEIATENFMPSMFARQRQSSPAAVSKTIRQLIDKELVTVSLNSSDGRQRDYVLTSKGKRVIQRLRKSREQAIQQVWLDMSSSRIETFSQIATELNDKLALLVNGQ